MPGGLSRHLGQTLTMVYEALAAYRNVIGVPKKLRTSAADQQRLEERERYRENDLKDLQGAFAVFPFNPIQDL